MPRLTIQTPDGTVGLPDRWLAFIARELREADRFVIADDGRRNSYAQAFNHHGTLLLEHRDGSPQRHHQVTDVELAEVADALARWSRGERAFIQDHEWHRLRDWDEPSNTEPNAES